MNYANGLALRIKCWVEMGGPLDQTACPFLIALLDLWASYVAPLDAAIQANNQPKGDVPRNISNYNCFRLSLAQPVHPRHLRKILQLPRGARRTVGINSP